MNTLQFSKYYAQTAINKQNVKHDNYAVTTHARTLSTHNRDP